MVHKKNIRQLSKRQRRNFLPQQIKMKLQSKTVVGKQLKGVTNIREPLEEEEFYRNLDSESDLSEILSEVLSSMSDEEFDEAWAKVKERVDYNGTGNQIL